MNEKAFTACVLTSSERARKIASAQSRIVLCSPGVTPSEADALITAQRRLPADATRVLVDFTPTSFRIGYWGEQSPADVARLADDLAHAEIAQGLRLGILIVDAEGYIFMPIAQSLEREQVDAQEPNALRLNARETEQLLASITSMPHDTQPNRPKLTSEITRLVAQQAAKQNVVKPTERRLLELLRQRISIVQFEVHGNQLSRKSLTLPPEIVAALGSKDEKITKRITASWKIFEPSSANQAETDDLQRKVYEELATLKSKHLRSLSHYGFGLVSDEKEDFETAWKGFQEGTVTNYTKHLLETVNSLVEESRSLLKRLLEERAALGQLTIPHTPSLFPKPPEVERDNYIELLLSRVRWPNASEVASGVVIKKKHYDLTPELLNDEEFIRELEKAFREDFSQIRKTVEEEPGTRSDPGFTFSLN